MIGATDLRGAFDAVTEHWSPKVIARINDQYLKVAKVKGEFVWHKHDEEDELFYIVKGELLIEYQDRPSVLIREGEFHIVPKNTMHNPCAEPECWVVLLEPVSTKHTGDVVTDRTRTIEDQLR